MPDLEQYTDLIITNWKVHLSTSNLAAHLIVSETHLLPIASHKVNEWKFGIFLIKKYFLRSRS